jgi:hypothetical protein
MEGKHILMQSADLNENRILAIPENSYNEILQQVGFQVVGDINKISEKDFKHHDHWIMDYIEIKPYGSLDFDNDLDKKVRDLFRKFGIQEIFDVANLMKDEKLVKGFSDYRLVKGDLYLLRFEPTSYKNQNAKQLTKGKNGCFIYFVDSTEIKEISLTKERVEIKKVVNGSIDSLEFNRDIDYYIRNCKGNFSIEKVGKMEVTRKCLNPFISTGTYGSSFSNPPVLELKGEKEINNMITYYNNSKK